MNSMSVSCVNVIVLIVINFVLILVVQHVGKWTVCNVFEFFAAFRTIG